ncbi:MAG: hypothetical protein ACXVJW_20110, partial [Acidimicrobiia bacterium]
MDVTRTSSVMRRAHLRVIRQRVVRLVALVAVVLAPLVAIPATAAHALTTCDPGIRTKVWDGGASTSSWDDAANWSPDAVPTTVDHVCINTGTGVTITSATVQSLESQKPLTISGSLDLTSTTQGSTLGSTTTLDGTLSGAASKNLTGTIDWDAGGQVSGPGALTVAAGGTLRLPSECVNHRYLNGSIVNRGTIDYP